jgi:hypothetical protein
MGVEAELTANTGSFALFALIVFGFGVAVLW